MRRFSIARMMGIVAAFALVLSLLSLLTKVGFFGRRELIETLDSPVVVRGWSPSGLKLADGRTVQLPGFQKLPTTSAALAIATKPGVEIGKSGRVHCLIDVHHWCGNNSIRKQIARVDLSLLMMYLRQGQFTLPTHPEPTTNAALGTWTGKDLAKGRWDPGDYSEFCLWSRLVMEAAKLPRGAGCLDRP